MSQQAADEKNGELAVRNAAVGGAAANLGRLLAMKALATVRSPFAGVVTARNADVGDLVGLGSGTAQPIFQVADLHRIRICVSVPQSHSAAIRLGETATLSVPDYPDCRFAAQVVGTSGAIDGETGAFEVHPARDRQRRPCAQARRLRPASLRRAAARGHGGDPWEAPWSSAPPARRSRPSTPADTSTSTASRSDATWGKASR